jgi:RimJ/RimL family protein N-acetyltransferase|tara:strand:+ start:7913 stop:8293 length:381 start_codon:yes stop_codon:yes gene_type:complete
VLGTVGVNAPPDATGSVGIAFSIYEDQQNKNYTKEATQAVVDWILAQEGVKSLRMTIHPKNFAAVRVAQHSKIELWGHHRSNHRRGSLVRGEEAGDSTAAFNACLTVFRVTERKPGNRIFRSTFFV